MQIFSHNYFTNLCHSVLGTSLSTLGAEWSLILKNTEYIFSDYWIYRQSILNYLANNMCDQVTLKRNRTVPSEVKIACGECEKKLKFRSLKDHLKSAHDEFISIFCKLGTNCQWTCCVSFKCFIKHARHIHNEYYENLAANCLQYHN